MGDNADVGAQAEGAEDPGEFVKAYALLMSQFKQYELRLRERMQLTSRKEAGTAVGRDASGAEQVEVWEGKDHRVILIGDLDGGGKFSLLIPVVSSESLARGMNPGDVAELMGRMRVPL